MSPNRQIALGIGLLMIFLTSFQLFAALQSNDKSSCKEKILLVKELKLKNRDLAGELEDLKKANLVLKTSVKAAENRLGSVCVCDHQNVLGSQSQVASFRKGGGTGCSLQFEPAIQRIGDAKTMFLHPKGLPGDNITIDRLSEGILPFWQKYHRGQSTLNHEKFAVFYPAVKRFLKVQTEMEAGSRPLRTLHTSGQAQLCNRIRNLMSGFLLGIVTDRAVVPNFAGFPASYDDLFQSPMRSVVGAGRGSATVSHFKPQDTLCQDFQEHKSKGDLKVTGLSWLGKLFYLNPSLHDEFVERVGHHKDAYQATILHLLEPARPVEMWFEEFYNRNHLEQKIVISIHIRNGFYKLQDTDWQHYRDCADLVTDAVLKRKGEHFPVAWYVATDSPTALNKSHSFFTGAMTQHKRPIELLSLTEFNDNTFLEANSVRGVQEALVELLLLSVGDGRVLTPGSSYSGFAFAVAGAASDSVYVRSANRVKPTGPMKEHQIRNLSEWCFKGLRSDPVMDGLDQIIESSRCKTLVKREWLDM